MTTYKKTASLFALSFLTACGTNQTGSTDDGTAVAPAFAGHVGGQDDGKKG
jgi:hypothetical protein